VVVLSCGHCTNRLALWQLPFRQTQPSQILADWLRNPPPDEKRKQA